MRTCPVCESDKRELIWRADFLVIDGWTRPPYLDWMLCECGMIYGDNPNITQKDYDKYYIERYGFGVTDAEALARLRQRAIDIDGLLDDKNSVIVDFGGGEGGLSGFLKGLGFTNTIVVGCGDAMPAVCDLVIAEHVLEHVYDMSTAMQAISASLKDDGYFIIDIPNASQIACERVESMPILGFSQVHVNQFRLIDMLRLCERYGFELITTRDYRERGGVCSKFVFVKHPRMVAEYSRDFIQANIAAKVEKMKAIGDKPVIIWGLGDIALYCLALQSLNVVHYIDIDPAMQGATLQDIPILSEPQGDYPIVVNVQSQKSGLLEYIKSKGYKNEIIII